MTLKIPVSLRSRIAAGAALAVAVWLTGCVVTSVHPFYQPKDVVFDSGLLGVWAEKPGAADTWTFTKLDDRTYKFVISNGEKHTEFDARLFKLGHQLFLDCLPRERAEFATAVHHLLRVDALTPQLEVRTLDLEWLADLVEKQPRAIRHVLVPKPVGEGDGGELVLTAETADLQKFLRKHLNNEDAWTDKVTMQRLNLDAARN